MPQTPLSSTSAYCTAAQVTQRCDWRTLADYLSDTETRLADKATVEASAILTELRMAASGELEAGCLKGGMYRPEDLRAIADAVIPTNATALLADVVVGLLLRKVFRRRPDRDPPHKEMMAEAQEMLQAVSEGRRIFPTEETVDAGHLDHTVETARVIQARQGIVYQAREFFGRRADRNDPTRQ